MPPGRLKKSNAWDRSRNIPAADSHAHGTRTNPTHPRIVTDRSRVNIDAVNREIA